MWMVSEPVENRNIYLLLYKGILKNGNGEIEWKIVKNISKLTRIH